jgi:UDP-N-acetylmuramoylalanine-D-glutamate ligase
MTGSSVFRINEPTFSWSGTSLHVSLTYSTDQRHFEEMFDFTFPSIVNTSNPEALVSLVRLVAIAAAPSYYKALGTENVDINFPAGSTLKTWAESLFDEGLREFRFTNNQAFADVPSVETPVPMQEGRAAPNASLIERCLVPIGGGKDSATSLELLRRSNVDIVGFSVGDFDAINATAEVAGINLVRVKRVIDPQLIALNEAGAPNGHVPVTAITSTLACVAALCINADAVVMSNESSADEPTRVIDGIEVNHQWSKSLSAENLLREALSASGVTINYFSLLRPLSEFSIFSLFSTFEKFHSAFTSCNRAFTIDPSQRSDSWCGDCDKCRFVFLGLSAFRGNEYASQIIGADLFDDDTQLDGFIDLLGVGDAKPFECVGTMNETRAMARRAVAAGDTSVGRALAVTLSSLDPTQEKTNHRRSSQNVPAIFLRVINEALCERYIHDVHSSISSQTFGVMGLGRDTSAIIRFLDRVGYTGDVSIFLPEQPGVSHEEFEDILASNNLADVSMSLRPAASAEMSADLIFMSPGISHYSDEVVQAGDRATTPLAWWLELNKEVLSTTMFIGITGTKGKSTTSSMVAHVLDRAIVAGNLGNAVGDIPFSELVDSRYVVLETSSFQASYVKTSPDIVAITSLFDCHIDWHRTPENYYKDKLNLAAHGAGHVVYNKDIVELFEKSVPSHPDLSEGSHTFITHLIDIDTASLRARNEAMTKVIAMTAEPELTEDDIDQRLENFEDLKYRHEKIADVHGVTYISDVLSTAPEAVLATVDDTLAEYSGHVYLLFGGAHRDVDHSTFIKEMNERSDRVTIVALPETGHLVETQLENVHHGDELADGFAFASSNAQPGDVVLLAPGAPSFHRYDNYEKLAEHFEKLVSAL